MRSLILSFSLFIGLMLIEFKANASHLIGADITYKQIDTKKFRFDFVFYRDCNGIPFSNPSSNTFLKCKNGSSYGVNLTMLSIKKIDLANDTSCSKNNTTGQGTGFEEHRYYCIIDFDSSPYKALYNCSETLIMETAQCCRTSSISTGLGGTAFYAYAELNLKASNNKNSSPVFSTQPIIFLNGNQSNYQTFNAIDTVERDSLSYIFAPVKTSYTTNATYNTGYNYYQPFKAFYPGSLKYPFYNLEYNPVIGIYLDEQTGDLVYTPIKLDEVSSYAIEVTELRKDSTNNYVKIGCVRREIMGIVQENTYNSQPEITVKNRVYYVFERDSITIDFDVNDAVRNPPSPFPKNAPDTVTLNWSNAVPGATFDIISNSSPRESAKFRWIPKKGTISNVPYTFVVTAKDNHAGFYGISSKTYSIYVIDRPTLI
jgi:hypothetical protein